MHKYFYIPWHYILCLVLNKSRLLQCIAVIVFSINTLEKKNNFFENYQFLFLEIFWSENGCHKDNTFRRIQFYITRLLLRWIMYFSFEYWSSKVPFHTWPNLIPYARFFWHTSKNARPIKHAKNLRLKQRCVSDWGTTKSIAFMFVII